MELLLLKDSGCRLELTTQKLGLICFLMFVDKLCEGRKLRLSYHSGTIVQSSSYCASCFWLVSQFTLCTAFKPLLALFLFSF